MISATRFQAPLRRAGVHPVIVRDTLGHSKVDLAMNRYDKTSTEYIRAGLKEASKRLLGSDFTKEFATSQFETAGG